MIELHKSLIELGRSSQLSCSTITWRPACIFPLTYFYFTTAGQILRKIKERVRNLQLQKAKQHLLTKTTRGHQPLQHVREGKIHQQLNHFSQQDISTFPQVYKNFEHFPFKLNKLNKTLFLKTFHYPPYVIKQIKHMSLKQNQKWSCSCCECE